MASSTYKSFLMYKKTTGSGDYAKLVDIKDYPDLGGAPEMLETTTLSDGTQTYTPGIQSIDAMSFACNYDEAKYREIKALEKDELMLAVWFGGTENADGTVTPTGTDGKFEFNGKVSVFATGGGVNEVRGMTVTAAPSTTIKLAAET